LSVLRRFPPRDIFSHGNNPIVRGQFVCGKATGSKPDLLLPPLHHVTLQWQSKTATRHSTAVSMATYHIVILTVRQNVLCSNTLLAARINGLWLPGREH